MARAFDHAGRGHHVEPDDAHFDAALHGVVAGAHLFVQQAVEVLGECVRRLLHPVALHAPGGLGEGRSAKCRLASRHCCTA
jgi:hypothetical protein